MSHSPDVSERDLVELLDREKIRDCLARVARGEDRRNAELVGSAYWPQAMLDYGVFAGSFEEYLAWVVPGSPDIAVTQHILGQSLIKMYVGTALVETHVLVYHRAAAAGAQRDIVIGGRYLDWMDKVDGDWRISRRRMVYDWNQDLGDAVDPSAGLMGIPLDAATYSGRAHGDPSERFLGDRCAGVDDALA